MSSQPILVINQDRDELYEFVKNETKVNFDRKTDDVGNLLGINIIFGNDFLLGTYDTIWDALLEFTTLGLHIAHKKPIFTASGAENWYGEFD